MMEQALCCLAHGELAWLLHEPHTGLDDCLNMLLPPSSFRGFGGGGWRRPNGGKMAKQVENRLELAPLLVPLSSQVAVSMVFWDFL